MIWSIDTESIAEAVANNEFVQHHVVMLAEDDLSSLITAHKSVLDTVHDNQGVSATL